MRSLKESILADIDTQIKKGDNAIKDEIKTFIKENYFGATIKISKKPNADGKYEVSSNKDIEIKNKNITSLTNEMFVWSKIDGTFDCLACKSLTSLEGAPKEVGKMFICVNCKSLKNLKGASEVVGGNFYCFNCSSLESLEGAPKEVGENFDCEDCKVKFTEADVKKVSNVKGRIVC